MYETVYSRLRNQNDCLASYKNDCLARESGVLLMKFSNNWFHPMLISVHNGAVLRCDNLTWLLSQAKTYGFEITHEVLINADKFDDFNYDDSKTDFRLHIGESRNETTANIKFSSKNE